MRGTLFAFFLIAALRFSAIAQDTVVTPSVTLNANTRVVFVQPSAAATRYHSSYRPPFCLHSTCLYYAGDFDSSDDSALFNADYDDGSMEGQAWVGVKPDQDVTVTGATFVQGLTSGYTIANPTPFAVQLGIKPGQAGRTICNTTGNAAISEYAVGQETLYAYTIQKLAKPCTLKKGKVYYVNLLPTSTSGYGYVVPVSSQNPPNHHGWKNDLNDCYFNGATFGLTYVTCGSQGYFPEFSIALTGKDPGRLEREVTESGRVP